MGNQYGMHINSDDDDDDFDSSDNELGFNVINFTVNAMDMELRSDYCNHELPVIRSKPDLVKFQNTDMYKEIRASSGLVSNPDDRWNLVRALQQRENGMASPHSASFSKNQQRYISNLYIPNKKSTRLMSLDSKIFVTKFNRTGTKLLTACQDGFVRIYDGAKGTYHLLNRIRARDVEWSIIDADFSPNGQHFAYSTWSRSFFIMPVNGGEDDCQWIDVNGLPNHRLAIFSLRYSPTGDKIIGGSNNANVIVTDIRTRSTQILRTHRMPGTDVNSVCFLHDKDPNVIIAGCDDGLLKVYDLRTSFRSRELSKSVASFIGHYDGVTYLDSRNDGYHVLSNSKDQSIKIWDMRQPSNLRNRSRARQQQLDLTMWDYRWNRVPREFYNPNKALDGDTSIMTYRGHRVTKTLLRAKFSPLEQTGQRYIYTGCATGRIIIYDVLTGKIQEAIEGHRNVIRDLDWHPERSEIVSGSWDTHVHLNNFSRSNANRPVKRSHSSGQDKRPLRRSRRLANRNVTPD
ncbi:DDB1- and CUL4-associated factor 11 [Drosophila gunungcola]|uniref:DDB1- and CUL4-associated factor 11 n=1 Tax=Drosophila elegans TaxID=30023 RepID=UPI0007E656F1|nr:DDB1- and CUL4-associated factor 11 [Drosophila elegans]XP_052840394.1 DDB1- and CUL4-associated factor 11 [Drosophila gunungcola]